MAKDADAAGAQAYVSSHYRLGPNEVGDYLAGKGLEIRITETEINVKDCPFCKGARGLIGNLWKLYFSRSNGTFFCHRCGSKGNFFQFKGKLGDLRLAGQIRSPLSAGSDDEPGSEASGAAAPVAIAAPAAPAVKRPTPDTLTKHAAALFNSTSAMRYLTTQEDGGRGLSEATLKHYRVGFTTMAFPASLSAADGETPGAAWVDHPCITFPWIRLGSEGALEPVRIKARSMLVKAAQRLEPRGGEWGLFGWHTVPSDATELIITEGEYDAMAVWQATGRPAVSLPNGARSLPTEVLPMLERFSRIYLWMDDDVAGQEGGARIAKKLGEARCRMVHARAGLSTGPKDANDALRLGLNLEEMVTAAQTIQHEQIVSFKELRAEVLRELTHPQQAAGVQSQSLPSLNRILKGHRPGELTIVSGATGCGKTSLLSQLSLDYAAQGVRTLWGSFEINNVRLLKKMLTQYAGKKIDTAAEFDAWADRFEGLPLYFLKFFGSTQISDVIEAMTYAAYANDVSHVVLDNLQFMSSGQGKGFEKFELLDRSIELLRKFATDKQVHVSLVVHPRKTDDELTISSVFGTAKATQEADNVILMQRNGVEGGGMQQYLDIRKNRWDGELGVIPYRFDKVSGNVYEAQPSGAVAAAAVGSVATAGARAAAVISGIRGGAKKKPSSG